ncbi:2'-5' RNA ligase family protein [Propionibacteriaceae bacterium G1746]|uniref:2'-5' RNA ligase family protein n=1 Tax=Aestuariimicrobium sp. G57 TaxID=3418485 RepID=UPI003C169E11
MWTLPSRIGDTPDWHGGRRHALVWAVLLDEPAHQLTAAARGRLGGVVLPRYARQPHVTVRYAGLAGEPGLPGYGLEQLRRDLAGLDALVPGAPPQVRATGWSSFPMVPYLGMQCAWLDDAHRALAAPDDDPGAPYRPHLTVGQYAVRMPVDKVLERLADCPAQGEWAVGELALLRYETHDISGPLAVEGTVDLATGRWAWAGAAVLRPHRG